MFGSKNIDNIVIIKSCSNVIFKIANASNLSSFIFDRKYGFTLFRAEKDRSVEQLLHGVHNNILNEITM